MCRHQPRHLVAGGYQTKNLSVPAGTFANGENGRVTGAAPVVHHHTPALGDGQSGSPGQRILGADTGGEHHQIRLQVLAVGKVHAPAVFLTTDDLAGCPGQVDCDSQRFDTRAQGSAALGVQLHRHQPGREFHHMGFQTQRLERVGRLQTEQTTAYHHTATGRRGRSADGIQIVQGAVHQLCSAGGAADRRHEGP